MGVGRDWTPSPVLRLLASFPTQKKCFPNFQPIRKNDPLAVHTLPMVDGLMVWSGINLTAPMMTTCPPTKVDSCWCASGLPETSRFLNPAFLLGPNSTRAAPQISTLFFETRKINLLFPSCLFVVVIIPLLISSTVSPCFGALDS